MRQIKLNQSKKTFKENDALISFNENRKMFNKIAKRYDLINRIISLGFDKQWRQQAIKKMNIKDGNCYIDIGCGTGDSTVMLSNMKNNIHSIGIDPSFNMIKIAKEKVIKRLLCENIRYSIGSALNLPFKNNTFDGAIFSFSIRNVTNQKQTLEEVLRVLKPKSSLVILELGVPENRILNILYLLFSRIFISLVSIVLSRKSAYRYLQKSIDHFPSALNFQHFLKNIGFTKCSYSSIMFGVVKIYYGEKNLNK